VEGQVYIEGLREFRRDLRRIDVQLGQGITDALRDAAEIVAAEARRRAPRGSRPIPPGRRPRKRLADAIRPRVRGDVALVVANVTQRSAAWPQGYRYPRRYEYGDRNRPFLRPALAAKQAEVERALERLLDKIGDTWEG
jgi:hypothetical protein